ncbi:integrase [Friedmanniella endophytica]|uniref:Integrase n=1 Tax=Microlunatus kandeliicorticis TaxID=1759536 RepID=A0A7W3P5J1_9ACTN|nr:tyrosine-type recombinase/integrase [Microlunatus kandeliicorticis]MBA8794026.1 integrase [Microlunatus kandeliicorticis]
MSGRRVSGDGSVYQLSDGTWRGVIDLGWHGGKRRRKYIRGRTKAEVAKETRRLAGEADAGRLSHDRAPTLSGWLDRYLTEVAATTVRPSTLSRYRQEVRLYIAPVLGAIRLDKLDAADISAFYQDQLRVLSPGSVRRLHALLRRSLNVAVRWQVMRWNPVLAVDPPSVETKEVHPFSVEEARRFLRVVQGDRLEARWMLAVMLGMRQGEALGLSWADVDFDKATVRVRQALQYRSGNGLELVAPKTARSKRTVPMSESIMAALKLRREEQDADRVAAGEFWEDWGLVFTTKVGTPFSPRNDYRNFIGWLEEAGLRRVRLHDLRHTAASLMLAQGVPARVVMQTLGHSQISITLNTYSHVSPDLSRLSADRMESLLGGSDSGPLAAIVAASEDSNGPLTGQE